MSGEPCRVILLDTGDRWQGLYVDGHLIEEGHSVVEGDPYDPFNLVYLAEKHNFSHRECDFRHVEGEALEKVEDRGGFPARLSDV